MAGTKLSLSPWLGASNAEMSETPQTVGLSAPEREELAAADWSKVSQKATVEVDFWNWQELAAPAAGLSRVRAARALAASSTAAKAITRYLRTTPPPNNPVPTPADARPDPRVNSVAPQWSIGPKCDTGHMPRSDRRRRKNHSP